MNKLSRSIRSDKSAQTNKVIRQVIDRFQHRMSGRTSFNDGHLHRFRNFTNRFIPGIRTHRHTFNGITQITERHRHFYSGITGPAINGQGARHFHRFRQRTRIADGHTHIISGRTSVPIRVRGSSLSHHRHEIIVENIKTIKKR